MSEAPLPPPTEQPAAAPTVAKEPQSQPRSTYACRMCRRQLFRTEDLMYHDPAPNAQGHKEFIKKSGDQRLPDTTCSSLFLDPESCPWVLESAGDDEATLLCVGCKAKIGSRSWVGTQCSCGAWVSPAFKMHQRVGVSSATKGKKGMSTQEDGTPLAADDANKSQASTTSQSAIVLGAIALVILGMLEGAGFQLSGVTAPFSIRGQMTFKIQIVLKLFLSAVGSSMVVQAVMSKISPEKWRKSRCYAQESYGYARAVGGCALLGIGMSLAGSGPTMAPSQIGARVVDALIVFCGMFLGALIYGVVEKAANIRIDVTCAPDEKLTIDQHLKTSYAAVALPMGGAMLLATVLMEIFIPQSEDAKQLNVGLTPPLPPIVAGLIVGMNQIPIRYITGDGQGGSKSVVNMVAIATGGKLQSRFFIDSVEKAYQLLYVYVGTTLGSFLCGFSESRYIPPTGMGWWQSLLGGILMLFGARLAGGCTCGNGISGTSELSLQSFAAACAIFGFGIIAGYVAEYGGF